MGLPHNICETITVGISFGFAACRIEAIRVGFEMMGGAPLPLCWCRVFLVIPPHSAVGFCGFTDRAVVGDDVGVYAVLRCEDLHVARCLEEATGGIQSVKYKQVYDRP